MNKINEKSSTHGTFGPRAGRDHQPRNSVIGPGSRARSDRVSSANLKAQGYLGGSINIKVEAAVATEYNAADTYRYPKGCNQLKEKGPGRQLSQGSYNPVATTTRLGQKKRGSAAASLGSHRPSSLIESARASSTGTGGGIYAKMVRTPA